MKENTIEIDDLQLPNIFDKKLANGMNISLVEYGNLPLVNMQFIINIGSLSEIKHEQQWLTSFLANYLKEGSKRYNGTNIIDLFASYGGSIDISSSDDNLFINAEVLSKFATNAIQIIADILRNPIFPIQQQRRIKDDLLRNLDLLQVDPQALTSARLNYLIFQDHPYGREFPQKNNVEKFSHSILKSFYKNAIDSTKTKVYVIGNFDINQIDHQLENSFGDWGFGNGNTVKRPKLTQQNTWSLIDREEAHQSTIKLGMRLNNFSIDDYPRLIMINALLGGTFISRITTNIREDKGYSYSPISQLSVDKQYCFWTQAADVSTEVTKESFQEIFFEINRLTQKAPSSKELNGMITHLSGLHLIRFSTPRSIISQLFFADKLNIQRSFFESYISILRDFTPQSIFDQVNKSFNDNYFIAIAGDKKNIYEKICKLKYFRKVNEY